MHCPSCLSDKIKKNGHTHYGKQRFRCKVCGRQFVTGSNHYISMEKRNYIEDALTERLSLRAICRVFKVSLTWLQHFAHSLWRQVPSDLGARLPGNNRQLRLQFTAIQIDELWSYVGCKANKQWIWLAYHPESHQVIGYQIGNRDGATFKKLWEKLPRYWRKNFDFATDCLQAYKSLIPDMQHFSEKSLMQQIEAFNGRIRSRCSRLVRKTRSFSKVKKYHEQAIGFFLYKSNLEYQQATLKLRQHYI
jgi:insertion element IS1 protein InsB